MSTIAVTATAQPANLPPRVRVDIVDSGTPAITVVNVLRRDAAGTTVPVRTPDGLPLQLVTSGSTRIGTVYDYEAPYSGTYTYLTQEQPASVSAAVTFTVTRPWLIDPGLPANSIPLEVVSMTDRVRDITEGVFSPMRRATAVIVTDGQRKAPTGALVARTRTAATQAALLRLLDRATVLLLNVPASKNWGVGTEYIGVGKLTERRVVRVGGYPMREWDLPYTVTDRPIGGQQPTYGWPDVKATYANWRAVKDSGLTWAQVKNPT